MTSKECKNVPSLKGMLVHGIDMIEKRDEREFVIGFYGPDNCIGSPQDERERERERGRGDLEKRESEREERRGERKK